VQYEQQKIGAKSHTNIRYCNLKQHTKETYNINKNGKLAKGMDLSKGLQGKQTKQHALIHSINKNLLISQKIGVSNTFILEYHNINHCSILKR
jgi:hypothetical protein